MVHGRKSKVEGRNGTQMDAEGRKNIRFAHLPRENRVDFKKIFGTNIPNFGRREYLTQITLAIRIRIWEKFRVICGLL